MRRQTMQAPQLAPYHHPGGFFAALGAGVLLGAAMWVLVIVATARLI